MNWIEINNPNIKIKDGKLFVQGENQLGDTCMVEVSEAAVKSMRLKFQDTFDLRKACTGEYLISMPNEKSSFECESNKLENNDEIANVFTGRRRYQM